MKFLYISERVSLTAIAWAKRLTQQMGKEYVEVSATTPLPTDADAFEQYCREGDIDMVMVCTAPTSKSVQRQLNRFRMLRIPYVFVPSDLPEGACIQQVLAPVTMLEEEVHKAEILSHLIRYTGTAVSLLQAKDYGSKAARNVGRIRTTLERFDRSAEIEMGKRDSMRLYKTLADYTADLLVLTASREYGLDDILFGPQERYVILHSKAPVLLLNPRDDLFSLCD